MLGMQGDVELVIHDDRSLIALQVCAFPCPMQHRIATRTRVETVANFQNKMTVLGTPVLVLQTVAEPSWQLMLGAGFVLCAIRCGK